MTAGLLKNQSIVRYIPGLHAWIMKSIQTDLKANKFCKCFRMFSR